MSKKVKPSLRKHPLKNSQQNGRLLENKFFQFFVKGWRFCESKPLIGYGALTILLVCVMATMEKASEFFKASILESQVVEFDGTCMPIKKNANWVKTGGSNTEPYSAYTSDNLIDLVFYNPSSIAQEESDDPRVLNEKLTYSVVYLGDYSDGHIEGAGVHPAADIRAPLGTPVYAVANGVVVKAQESNSGFGKNIVLKIPNAPYKKGTESLYVGYAHLSKIDVKEGDIIKKCEKIGEVGQTGTATTSHLHFQIDRESAPWHLYWPFSSQEATAAGMSFFEAVNAGLGQENARVYTINPMMFVQEYLDGYGDVSGASDGGSHSSAPEFGELDEFEVKIPEEVFSGETFSVEITAYDDENRIVQNFRDDFEFICSDSDVRIGDIKFQNGVASFHLTAANPGRVKCSISSNGISESERVLVSQKKDEDFHSSRDEDSIQRFQITARETLLMSGKSTVLTIVAMDENDGIVSNIPENKRFQISASQGRFSSNAVEAADFSDGKAEVVYTAPDTAGIYDITIGSFGKVTVEVVEKLNPIYEFQIQYDDQYYIYNVPKQIKIVTVDREGQKTVDSFLGTVRLSFQKGSGTFDPPELSSQDFNNGEAIVTMRVSSEGESVEMKAQEGIYVGEEKFYVDTKRIFTDVQIGDQHAEAIEYLRDKGIIHGYPDGSFGADKKLNRAEVAKMLIEGFNIHLESGKSGLSDIPLGEWFSDYVFTAEERGIVNGYPDKTFRAANTINKAEFFKMLLETDQTAMTNDVEDDPFGDVSSDDWFAKYARFAKDNQLLDFNGKFYPNEEVTRGDVAEAMYRLLK